jgi:hypothetical protein
MTLIGFWHGAAWVFIAWELWHGLLLTMENLLRMKPTGRAAKILYGGLTFHLVGIGWVLFASDAFATAWRYLVNLFSFSQMHWLPHYLPSILLTACLVFGIDLATRTEIPDRAGFRRYLRPVALIAALVVLTGLALLSAARGETAQPFIYGRF